MERGLWSRRPARTGDRWSSALPTVVGAILYCELSWTVTAGDLCPHQGDLQLQGCGESLHHVVRISFEERTHEELFSVNISV